MQHSSTARDRRAHAGTCRPCMYIPFIGCRCSSLRGACRPVFPYAVRVRAYPANEDVLAGKRHFHRAFEGFCVVPCAHPDPKTPRHIYSRTHSHVCVCVVAAVCALSRKYTLSYTRVNGCRSGNREQTHKQHKAI